MKLVRNLKELEANAFVLADILHSTSKDQPRAASLIRKGRAFYPFFYNGELAFSPSKFIGYRHNDLHRHLEERSERDGKDTNREINRILGCRYVEDPVIHNALEAYGRRIGVELEGHKHRFWPTESTNRFARYQRSAVNDLEDDEPGNDDPKYQIAMRGSYKRNPAVRAAVLKRAAGKCEFCGTASFLKLSGSAYLETHHIISLAKQGPDRLSNVIALCANHHREAHFGRDWQALEAKFQNVLAKRVAK